MVIFAFVLGLAFFQAEEQAPPAPVAVTDPVRARLDAGLGTLAGTGEYQTPALQTAVLEDGAVKYAGAFGAVTPDTRFPIASVTKLFTAVAIMQLVQAHRVELNAPIATYLPNAPYAQMITVRQLLQHTSGLWNYGDEVIANGLVKKTVTPQAILAYAGHHDLTEAPGRGYMYSNTGYVVLGLILEHVTGMTLAAYDRRYIFAPAGLTQTTVGPPPAGTLVAAGHMRPAGPIVSLPNYSWFYADGDIFSTATDLARFDAALMNGTLVSPATFALMQSDSVPTDGKFRQGLGLMVFDQGGLRFVGHHGGVPGFEADDEMVPAAGIAMTVISSAFNFVTGRAYNVLVPTLFPTFVPPGAVANDDRREDPAITARFKAAVEGLLAGTVDVDQYAPAARSVLTPAMIAQVAEQLKPLGSIAAVTYDGHNESGYRYRVAFSSGTTLAWRFALTRDGKIDSLLVDPQQ